MTFDNGNLASLEVQLYQLKKSGGVGKNVTSMESQWLAFFLKKPPNLAGDDGVNVKVPPSPVTQKNEVAKQHQGIAAKVWKKELIFIFHSSLPPSLFQCFLNC